MLVIEPIVGHLILIMRDQSSQAADKVYHLAVSSTYEPRRKKVGTSKLVAPIFFPSGKLQAVSKHTRCIPEPEELNPYLRSAQLHLNTLGIAASSFLPHYNHASKQEAAWELISERC